MDMGGKDRTGQTPLQKIRLNKLMHSRVPCSRTTPTRRAYWPVRGFFVSGR